MGRSHISEWSLDDGNDDGSHEHQKKINIKKPSSPVTSSKYQTQETSLTPEEKKTEVIYGTKKTTNMIVKAINNTISKWDNYANSQGPSIAIEVGPIRNAFKDAFKKGIKI